MEYLLNVWMSLLTLFWKQMHLSCIALEFLPVFQAHVCMHAHNWDINPWKQRVSGDSTSLSRSGKMQAWFFTVASVFKSWDIRLGKQYVVDMSVSRQPSHTDFTFQTRCIRGGQTAAPRCQGSQVSRCLSGSLGWLLKSMLTNNYRPCLIKTLRIISYDNFYPILWARRRRNTLHFLINELWKISTIQLSCGFKDERLAIEDLLKIGVVGCRILHAV